MAIMASAAIALARGDWNGAERNYKDFKQEHEQLRALTRDQAKAIVKATCEAEEADRKAASDAAGKQAKDTVGREYDSLQKRKNLLVKMLDEVTSDGALKDQHRKADEYKKDSLRRWDSIDRMSKSIRGANHPVVAYMLEQGQKAHEGYQEKCDVAEFKMSVGTADCIQVTGCMVIELKPKNKKSLQTGQRQAQRYADKLNERDDDFKALVRKNGKFAECKEFTRRVDCYTLCPVIDENGEYRSASAGWDKDCR